MAKVLVIDGDADTAQALRDALTAQRIDTEVVADGNEGLERVRTFQPNAIVLCVELPRVSGYSICNKLKKDPSLSAIPLILTSSQATEETFEQHKKLKTRAEGYIKKPYELGALLTVLSEYVPVKAPGGGAPAGRARAPIDPLGDELSGATVAMPIPTRRPTSENLGLDLSAFEDAPAAPAARPAAAAPRGASKPSPMTTTSDALGDLDADLAPTPTRQRPKTGEINEPVPAARARPSEYGNEGSAATPVPRARGEFNLEGGAASRQRSGELNLDTPATRQRSGELNLDAPATRSRSGELNLDAPAARARTAEINLDELAPAPRQRSGELNLDAPAARPRSPAAELGGAAMRAREPDPQLEQLRNETKQLRQKVAQLEQSLQQKELEFNDRLLEETTRSRDSVELKKKIQMLERDLGKYQQAAEKARADADQAAALNERAQQDQQAFEQERAAFTEKMGSLLEKVKVLAAERQDLQRELDEAKQAHLAMQQDLETSQKARQKAKKAVDIAVQLLEETGLFGSSPS